MTASSPGREALAEAARLEQARIYAATVTPSAVADPPNLDSRIAYWHRRGQSTASIAFRVGVPKSRVVETLQRLGAA